MASDARTRTPQPTHPPAAAAATTLGDALLLTVTGLVDERFPGFGQIGPVRAVVIDVSGITRMTSFGVRQWLKSMDALPKSITDTYLYGCPTFFVDQLNMVLNFGGAAKVLSVMAPYSCPSCGAESAELIDVLAERATLATQLPEKECRSCGAKLEFDETPESYFAFATKYGATTLHPSAAQLLASKNLYTLKDSSAASEKPVRTTKLVHGAVTYYRISGTIGRLFRARPFIVGAEGEIVIDLVEVDQFDEAGLKEWRRLLKTLSTLVTSVTLVDISEPFLKAAPDTFTVARNVIVCSLLAPYQCVDCGRTFAESEVLASLNWPPTFADRVCSTCGGTTRCNISADALKPLQKAITTPPPASAKVVEGRQELLSRALTDANVAQAGGGAANLSNTDTVLGKYKIVRRLSGGGMADVFLAKQVGIGGFEKPVALKRILNDMLKNREQAIEFFLNEAKIAGRLIHPNIVQVLDVGEVSGALYLAMEYVHGKDLRDVVKSAQKAQQRLPLAEACHIVREVALALDFAYWSNDMAGKRLSVVHRDVSPHNIILAFDGSVKLLDFGVAMSSITETKEKLIVGKWTYMAPETTLNSLNDHRSDLFSLGVVFYLLTCGAMPFSGSSPKELLPKIRGGHYRRVDELAPEVPPQLARLISRLLDPNPDQRPQRGQEVVNELNEIMRQNGFESSGQRVAELLARMFPQLPSAPGGREMVRVARDEPSLEPTRVTEPDKSPVSITPSAATGFGSDSGDDPRRRRLSASISIHPMQRRSGQIASPTVSQTFVPTISQSFSPTVPTARQVPQLPQAPDSRSNGRRIIVLLTMLAVAVGVALWWLST